jgi:hypothetical protein
MNVEEQKARLVEIRSYWPEERVESYARKFVTFAELIATGIPRLASEALIREALQVEPPAGNCAFYAQEAARMDPSLTAQPGWFTTRKYGEVEHWWCKYPDGTIFDPSRHQYTTSEPGEYREYDPETSYLTCTWCNRQFLGKDRQDFHHRLHYCSSECYHRDIGF